MMRRLTKSVLVSGVLCCLLSSVPAFAVEPAGGSPTPSADSEGDAVESEGGEPDASVVAPRSWLRQSKREARASDDNKTDESNGWPIVAFVLLSALGGAAVYMKYRRGAASFLLSQADVRVLSTTRIGAKSQLVVADIHGRMLLLGVTEQSVSELGWLDDAGRSAEPADDAASPQRGEYPQARPQSRFGDALATSLGRAEDPREAPFRGNPNVAAMIAANAPEDVVYTRRGAGRTESRNAPRAVAAEANYGRVEDQVAGLARRRR
jgi:flagellar biogenesis protein FliO